MITDGEQRKYHNFWTYCVHGLPNTAPDGFKIPFAAGHTRRMPRLTAGRSATSAMRTAISMSRSAMRTPAQAGGDLAIGAEPDVSRRESAGYSREEFIDDLLSEHETEIRRCLQKGAHKVQIDFTEGRLAMKLDPSGRSAAQLHRSEQSGARRGSSREERQRIGVHTCPGGDRDSTHSADVDYAELLPEPVRAEGRQFLYRAGRRAGPRRVLKIIREYIKPEQRVFVGVVVADRSAASRPPRKCATACWRRREYIPLDQLGTTDDCGFSPFCDDTSTTRDTAFAKIRARVAGTALAAEALGVR